MNDFDNAIPQREPDELHDMYADRPSPAPLSEAERIAAEILRRGWANGRGLQVPIEDRAREIVAAVRNLIAAEALDHFADKVDALLPGGEALGGAFWYRNGLRDAADMARLDAESARQSLSLPASKETQQ